jgi:hypothetical protein
MGTKGGMGPIHTNPLKRYSFFKLGLDPEYFSYTPTPLQFIHSQIKTDNSANPPGRESQENFDPHIFFAV